MMPRKARLTKRRRVAGDWVERLLVGELPEPDTEARMAFVGWLYFGDEVEGLPDPRSPEGHQLWAGKLCR